MSLICIYKVKYINFYLVPALFFIHAGMWFVADSPGDFNCPGALPTGSPVCPDALLCGLPPCPGALPTGSPVCPGANLFTLLSFGGSIPLMSSEYDFSIDMTETIDINNNVKIILVFNISINN